MSKFDRVTVVVLDGVGAGAAPDAADYGDVGSNSLANTARAIGGLKLPHMEAIGLGHIGKILGVPPVVKPSGGYGRLLPRSAGKDTISGHWEMMGIYLARPFPTYPHGFPPEIIAAFESRIGRGVLGNKPASGTEIIQELGDEHVRTGKPIVYTSADSVFQIAAHEDVIPLEELYHMCREARAILTGEHEVGRVIARPFIGEGAGNYARTEHRRDFPRLPDTPTILERLVEAGKSVYSVGKIDDIFAGQGITVSNHTTNNRESIEAVLGALEKRFEGLLFANLIEFDMIYGHRNDPKGYAGALAEFDAAIPEMQARMGPRDLAIISADHGVDPTTGSTDHSREYVPLLVFGQNIRPADLDTRSSIADIGATIAEIFSLPPPLIGESFLQQIT